MNRSSHPCSTPLIRKFPRSLRVLLGLGAVASALFTSAAALAHPLTFNSTITYSDVQPSGAAASVAQWSGAAFDAANVGGSGVNADGGANNGTANDASTRVVNGQPAKGQTFTTGSNPNGYDVSGITVRLAGYTNNTATGANQTTWDLGPAHSPIIVIVGKVNGTTHSLLSIQNFMAGGTGTPGSGTSANGPGTHLTFNLPFPVHLEPNTTYSFDLSTQGKGFNHFELLGTSADPYAGGTAYSRSGSTVTPLSGDRVFQVNMTASTTTPAPFVHPGALHTESDFDRMKAKIAADAAPWKPSFDALTGSRYASTGWGPTPSQYINRGGDAQDNFTRAQMDGQAIYQLSLRWKLTGDVAYANQAVVMANAWARNLLGITGDSNLALASGLCGYLFATGGEILSTYPGWPEEEKQAYRDMMMRVFYVANLEFLWYHFGTPYSAGGNTHYRLNWDTANMASMAAIGILCDNRAVYQQAVDFFKRGASNGRVERAAWYIHPDGTAQTEESGRDQPHNNGGWYAMGLLCQMAWNQGDDLFGYDNNRVLRAYEYNAKYNSGNDDGFWVYHRNTSLTYTEKRSGSGRSVWTYSAWELVYNHYANVKGIAAPWSKIAMNMVRPEGFPQPWSAPSQQDHLGLGSLTYARDDITTSAPPSGLLAQWSKGQLILNWWGSATATSYQIQRTASGASAAGPYTTLGTAVEPHLNFTDTTVAQGGSYYYKVVAITPTGNLESTPLLANQTLVASYTFEGNTNDGTGTRHATVGGATAPGYAAGFDGGQAISLNGGNQFVQLPVNSGLSRDVTLSAWVYWNGGSPWQDVFNFGSEIEKSMLLTVKDSSTGKIKFAMTTSRATDGTINLVGPVMPTATWTHLAVTFNGETATLYVNGLPVASGSSSRLSPMFSQTFCYLGRSMYNNEAYFNGLIDNFRIYNYALTGSDVYALWGQSANHAPEFTSNPLLRADATQGAAYTTQSIYNSATDADGGTLIYTKVSGPSWLIVAPNGALSGTPANSDNGKNLFIVRVTDPAGATDDAMLFVTVNNTNETPTWLSGTVVKPGVTHGQAYTASLSANATDPDLPYGDSISFSKIGGPAWLTIGSNGALTGTPGAGDVGLNTFTVRVTDAGGLHADATLEISVFPPTQRAGYLFDGNATDSVGDFDGTITGTPAYSSGRTGQALSLDGVDDYVTLPAGAASYREISISTWVYWNGGANWQRIFDFGNSTSSYLMLTPNSGSGMRFAIVHGGVEQQLNTTALPTGRWMHLAVTLGGSTATLYINGVAVATNTAITLAPDTINPAFNYIGKSQFVDATFNGQIDDFRIYNYALSAAEVDAIVASIPPPAPGTVTASGGNGSSQISLSWGATSGATSYIVKRSTVSGGSYTTIYTGTATSYADASVSAGVTYYYVIVAVNAAGESVGSTELSGVANVAMPKVHLRFDETTGSTAADASGNGWDATLVGGSTWTTGRINNAVSLSGTTNYATLPSGVVAGLGDFTLSAWVKINAFATFSRIFDFGTGTTNYMFLMPQYTGTAPNNAKLRFAIRTPGVPEDPSGSALNQITSSVALSTGTWAHVAVTLSGTTGQIYVNGALAGTTTTMTLKPSDLGVTTINYLGRSQFSADPYLNSAVDEFQIYGRALSAAEISALAAPLAAPGGVGVSVGNAQATLSWNAVSGATGYNIKRAPVSGGPYTVVGANRAGPNWTDTGLINGAGYYYVVTALNGVAESANSTEVSTTPVGPPPVPANVTATSSDGLVTLTWTASSGATSYNIKRSTTDGSGYLTIGTSTSETYADSTVTNGTAYYYVVTAVGPNGESAASTQASATPLAPPAAPTGLTATASNATVTLTWTASSGATSYNIKRSDTSGSDYELVGTTSATGYVDTDVVNGGLYYYVISAQNVAGEGADSTEATATPVAPPAAPSGAIASAGDGQSGLVWQAVSGATSYTIKRSTVSGGPYTVIASGLTTTSYFDNTAVNGTTYYYVISAVNAGGEGDSSIQLVVTPNDNPLRAHLRFDQTSGATVTDTSGNGWNGTLVGGSTYTAGKINNAVSLSGTSNYATMPTGVIAGLGNCTLSTWVKLNSLSTFARIFDFGTGTTNYMFLTPQGPTASRIRFAIRTPSVSEQRIDSTVNTPVDAWFHVAVTFSGSVGTLYVNGVSAGTNTGMTLTPSSLGLTTLNYLGKSQFSADSYLNGALDEFQIYGRALSAAEISALAAASLAGPSNLVATPGETQVALSWSAVSGATGYNVKRAYVSGGPYTILGSVTGTSYTDTNLAIGSPYYYVVSALSDVVESVNSAEASATPMIVAGNSGFESPTTASYIYNPTGTAWTFSGASGNGSGVTTNGSSFTGGNAVAPQGTQVAFLQGNGSVTQTLSGFSPGVAFKISFYASQRQNKIGGQPGQTFDVRIDGTPIGRFLPPQSVPGYTLYSVIFTATSTTHTLAFVGTNLNGGDNTAFVDAVAIDASAAVPPALRAVPAGLVATAGNAQVSLSWTAASGATSYTVKRATTSGGTYLTIATDVTGTAYTHTGLTNGTTYYYVVSAVSSGGESANSAQASATPQPPAPAAPTGLSATAGNAQVALSWSAVGGATSYTVKRSTTSGGAYTIVASGVSTPSYTNTGLTNDTTYHYVVSAVNGGGESANSTQATATPRPPAPGAPADLTATAGDTQVTLSWSASSGATSYTVKRSTTSGGSYTTVASGVTATAYTNTGLTNGTTYYYVVSAVNSGGESANSTQASATPLPPIPAAPTGLSAIGWNDAVDLSWSTTGGATGYNVKRATTSGGAYTTVASSVTATNYSDTAVTNGTTYYYVVSAINIGGESANSAEVSTTFTQPVVYLKFNETSGTSAADSSGNNWTGTLVNGPLWSEGRSNNTVDLDGSNDHVTLPTGVVNGLTNFTITLWANLDLLSTWSRLFDFGTGTSVNMFLTPKNGANDKIRFAITTGGGSAEQRIDGTAALPIGGWHHVAVTLSGSTGTLYVDGVQVGQNTAMTLTPSSLGSTTLNRIGRSQYADSYLMGRIDEFRVYSRALSAAEIVSLMNTSPAGLVPAPASLTATAGTAQVALNWSTVTGATSYDVMRTTTNGGLFAPVTTGLTTTSYTDTGLTAGTTYYYVIIARTSTSESVNSPQASATAQ